MSKIKRLSFKDKVKACELYDQGYGSLQSISDEFGISRSGFRLMYSKYKNHGSESLKMQTKHQTYTKEFKEKVIESYNNGEGSYRELAVKYGINNYSLICPAESCQSPRRCIFLEEKYKKCLILHFLKLLTLIC